MSLDSEDIVLNEEAVRLEDLRRVAEEWRSLKLGPAALERLENSRKNLLKHLAAGRSIYGTNTGVGALFTREIAPEEQSRLSENIVLSHACGVGEALEAETVRAIMFGAVCNLTRGYSGVRPQIAERLVHCLNKGFIPLVPSAGSIGSLTHMAHISSSLLGHGLCQWEGREMPSGEGLAKIGLSPLKLEAGEGLSLVSGTPSLVGVGGMAIIRARRLLKLSDIAAALSFEALRANPDSLHPRVHQVRPHTGQQEVARNLRELLEGSQLLSRENLQDCLSLRTTPQVHGSVHQTVEHATRTLVVELNSATDNPLIFEEEVLSACNAHGEPMSLCLDGLRTALAELGNISERRTDRLLNFRINGLPPFLIDDPGLHSGLMIPQYVSAYLVAENKILSQPASVDSIPMSAYQEDHVNMGTLSAILAQKVARNLTHILAVELLTARAALRFRTLSPGPKLVAVVKELDRVIPPVIQDRVLGPDIEKLARLLGSGQFLV